jgi:3-dehydroquinate dehydratase-1
MQPSSRRLVLTENRPRICAAIVENNPAAIKKVAPLVDMYEVRIDLIGKEWRKVAGYLAKRWIACNRRKEEGGTWGGNESDRIKELFEAVELGAGIVDIELATPGAKKIIGEIKGRAECLVSYHNIVATPDMEKLREIVREEVNAGADICKVVTTAHGFNDNLSVLKLIGEFPGVKITAFAMGPGGQISRVLCPLAGGYFTYTSIEAGKESAEGQITVRDLRQIYSILRG